MYHPNSSKHGIKKTRFAITNNSFSNEGVLTEEVANALKHEYENLILEHLDITEQEPDLTADLAHELNDIYKPWNQKVVSPGLDTKEMRLVDAITAGLDEAMQKHPKLVLMGQDIGDYGGVFKITDGFVKKFGKDAFEIPHSAKAESLAPLSA